MYSATSFLLIYWRISFEQSKPSFVGPYVLIILLTGYVAHAEEAMFDQTGETKCLIKILKRF
jgi:hypothetical protein